jgi:hypothetical protein
LIIPNSLLIYNNRFYKNSNSEVTIIIPLL